MKEEQKKQDFWESGIAKRIALAIFFSALLFSHLSYTVALPIYIIVPLLIAFLISFILPGGKKWWLLPVLISAVGSVLFASPPPLPHRIVSPADVILGIIFFRQSDIISFTPPLLMGILGGILGWGIAEIIRKKPRWLKTATYALFVLFCINFIAITLDLNPTAIVQASREPTAGEYNNFNSINLKTFYLMKRGMNFYEAYSNAFSLTSDSGGEIPANLWHWRMPTVFYIWKLLLPPDGFYVLYLYLLIGLCVIYFIFDISSNFLRQPLNLIPPILTSYIFIFGGAAFWFTFPEFWGVFFLFLGLWSLHRKNLPLAIAALTLAPLIRWIFIFPMFGIFIVLMFDKKRKLYISAGLPLLVFIVFFKIHVSSISHLTTAMGQTFEGFGNFLGGGAGNFISFIAFGAALLSRPRVALLAILLGFIVATVRIFTSSRGLTARLLIAGSLFPLLFFLKVGPPFNHDYWGVVFIPLIYASLPVAFSSLQGNSAPAGAKGMCRSCNEFIETEKTGAFGEKIDNEDSQK